MSDGRKIFGAFTIAIALFFFWPAVIGSWNEVSALRTAAADRETLLARRTDILAKVDTGYAEYQRKLTEQDGKKFAALVPVHKDSAELVSALQEIANGAGISIGQIRVAEGKATGTDQLNTLSLTIELGGSYTALRAFLSDLERYVRLLNVNMITVAGDGQSGNNKLRFTIRADAYFLK
jgi:Tfp pilus assembly protein PilO